MKRILTLIVCLLVSHQIRSFRLHHFLHLDLLINLLTATLLENPANT